MAEQQENRIAGALVFMALESISYFHVTSDHFFGKLHEVERTIFGAHLNKK